jgi:hypothetical protein
MAEGRVRAATGRQRLETRSRSVCRQVADVMECQRTWDGALIRTAGPEGLSGRRNGCFGGIITGDTRLACHGLRAAGGGRRKARTKRGGVAVAGGVEQRWGVPRGTGRRCGRDAHHHLFGAPGACPGLPERRGKRRAVAVHCTSPSQGRQGARSWPSGPAQREVQRQRSAGSAARPAPVLRAAFALLLPWRGGLVQRPASSDAMAGPPSAAV